MVVAMVTVRVVQVSVDEIVDVVAMGHSLMSAVGAMNMAGVVPGAAVVRRASTRVAPIDGDDMFVDVVLVRVVQVTVV